VRLPRVADVDPYGPIGVSLSRYGMVHRDPYVARAWVDEQLDAALAECRFVLVVGKSKSGKTRTAFEAIRRNSSEAALIIPKAQAGSLSRLLDLDPPVPVDDNPVVVWLDDLDR
jgi:hypothetical protein